VSYSRNQINEYLATIDLTDKIVSDVGCADEAHYARRKCKGTPKEYYTFEYAEDYKTDFHFDLNFPIAEQLVEHPLAEIVFCIETLEHIYDPIQAIENLHTLCKENGILYLTAPFINPLHDVHDYLRYTIQYFEDVLPKLGFEVIKIAPRVATFPDLLGLFYSNEGMRMSKITQQLGYRGNFHDIGYIVKARRLG